MKFNQSEIDTRIIKAVTEMGFEDMTPIQEKVIHLLIDGQDIIGQAQTGTGKTAAFGIPLVEGIYSQSKDVQALVLCPTRELAIQVTEEMRKFIKYMSGIKLIAVYGGQDMSTQIRGIKDAQIVIGTPGRIMDHMRRRTLKLQDVQLVVLDEADEMLKMGFREDIETILQETPKDRQTALFSATMPKEILNITKKYQRNAIHAKTNNKELTISLVAQYYFSLKSGEKTDVLCRLLDYHNPKRALIFCKTKRGADALAGTLKGRGYPAEPLHGDLSQGQRNAAMAQFRHGKAHILIATDVAARGLDVDDVETVFNYDIPMEEEHYVHRIGRTGRAGKEGKAFTFVVGKEIYKLMKIEEHCRTEIKKGILPSATQVTKMKSDKILHNALRMQKKNDLSSMKKLIRNKLEETGASIEDLAAALLQMEMGEEIKEVVGDQVGSCNAAEDGGGYSRKKSKKKSEGRKKARSGRDTRGSGMNRGGMR